MAAPTEVKVSWIETEAFESTIAYAKALTEILVDISLIVQRAEPVMEGFASRWEEVMAKDGRNG